MRRKFSKFLVVAALATTSTMFSNQMFINQAFAGDALKTEDMVRALKAAPVKRLTRSLGATAVDKERIKSRGLVIEVAKKQVEEQTHEDRKEITKIIKKYKLPTIDLTIYFKYNSADISPSSIPTMIKLGRALSDKELKEGTFLVAGHTDAKGSDHYNLTLSQRRAKAVKHFLMENFSIGHGKLVAVGYGEEELKDFHDPHSGENRRVQVTNLTH
ncbi:MAG: membrane protein [Methyloligella sp.]|nr:MAG: membrane protein [Methyloligella sp.]